MHLNSDNIRYGKRHVNPAKERCSFTVDSAFTVKTWGLEMEKLSRRQAQSVIGVKMDKIFPGLYEKAAQVAADGKKRLIKNFMSTCFLGITHHLIQRASA